MDFLNSRKKIFLNYIKFIKFWKKNSRKLSQIQGNFCNSKRFKRPVLLPILIEI